MTDREKAIVMAYTGICMLEGEKLFEFYKYLEELYERPVYTHEFLTLDMKERSEKDFMELCRREEPERRWIPCKENMPVEMQTVLTWDGDAYAIEKRLSVIRDDYGDTMDGDWWVSNEYDEDESEYYIGLREGTAIAWMPLPEPPEGE